MMRYADTGFEIKIFAEMVLIIGQTDQPDW